MYTFSYHWCWRLASSPAKLWPYASDTDRFDAMTGLPPISVRSETIDGEEQEVIGIRLFGMPVEWTQKPFEWIEPYEFSVHREYIRGPIAWMQVDARLERVDDGGTDLHYQVEAAPANPLGYLAIPIQIGLISQRSFERAFRQFDEIAQNDDAPMQQRLPLPQKTPIRDDTLLATYARELRDAGTDGRLVDALIEYVRTESDNRVARIRPFVLADLWDEDRIDVLKLCLYATRVGLLELQWDLICPSCRGTPHRADTLEDVDAVVSCPACQIDYEVDFEHTVEVTFHVHPSVRDVEVERYCHLAPRDTQHVIAQKTVAPGATLSLPLNVTAGAYRIRLPWHPDWNESVHSATTWQHARPWQARLEALPATGDERVVFSIADGRLAPERGIVSIDERVTVEVVNNSDQEHLVVVERTAWFERAATAARVTTLEAFRNFFATEALKLGLQIRAGTITVLFTDLEASTRLYQEVGDGPAFERVATHFDMLQSCVADNNGALVKTIGDAVMAAFIEPANGVRAALDILATFEEYNRRDSEWPLRIKVGVHKGPALAVTLNEQLDYFGTTVNLAARLQRESKGGEVVLSHELSTDDTVREVLDGYNLTPEEDAALLSGFDEETPFWRVRTPAHARTDHASAMT